MFGHKAVVCVKFPSRVGQEHRHVEARRLGEQLRELEQGRADAAIFEQAGDLCRDDEDTNRRRDVGSPSERLGAEPWPGVVLPEFERMVLEPVERRAPGMVDKGRQRLPRDGSPLRHEDKGPEGGHEEPDDPSMAGRPSELTLEIREWLIAESGRPGPAHDGHVATVAQTQSA